MIASEPAARCRLPFAQYADIEAGGITEMPLLPQGRYAPPARMIKLTEDKQITPCNWCILDEER